MTGTPQDQLASLLRAHGNIKAKLAAKAKAHKEANKPLKAALELVETGLARALQDSGSSLLKVKGLARVVPTKKTCPNCKDWPALYTHIVETGNFDLVQRRLSSTGVTDFMDTHDKALPPGVTIHVERGVTVTREN